MSDTAYSVQYRQELVATFEQQETLLRSTVTTETVVKGNQAVFDVSGSGGATAVTRGVNGLIPARANSNTQTTITLVEWHDLPRTTSFNIFASQGDQRAEMQRTTVGVINRKIDSDIITELGTGTVNTGAAVTASLGLVVRAKTILGNADVPWDNNITALITPAFEAYLLMTTEFGNQRYTNNRPLDDGGMAWKDRPQSYNWIGINWIVHPKLSGAGTNAEKCFLYHKSAIGHAMDMAQARIAAGYNEEQDYSWARSSAYLGTQILQDSGVVVMNHDGSAMAAA